MTARKHFFLKKEAKTFAYLAYALGQRERLMNKSFLVLFLKKELLAVCLPSGQLFINPVSCPRKSRVFQLRISALGH
jgi:hypothetical protein